MVVFLTQSGVGGWWCCKVPGPECLELEGVDINHEHTFQGSTWQDEASGWVLDRLLWSLVVACSTLLKSNMEPGKQASMFWVAVKEFKLQ